MDRPRAAALDWEIAAPPRHTRFVVDEIGLLAHVIEEAPGPGHRVRRCQARTLRWRGAFRADLEPAAHAIVLRDGWRTLVRVSCRPEDYPEVAALVLRRMREHGTAERCPERLACCRGLRRAVLALLAGLLVILALGH